MIIGPNEGLLSGELMKASVWEWKEDSAAGGQTVSCQPRGHWKPLMCPVPLNMRRGWVLKVPLPIFTVKPPAASWNLIKLEPRLQSTINASGDPAHLVPLGLDPQPPTPLTLIIWKCVTWIFIKTEERKSNSRFGRHKGRPLTSFASGVSCDQPWLSYNSPLASRTSEGRVENDASHVYCGEQDE
ncbi:hypothetical protein F2P79_002829 [Pimephales promelas]|nr:hypothetical protein F2P79_002829 [Pimephales promelas]